MATWSDIEKVRRNMALAKVMAKSLIRLGGEDGLNEFEKVFLHDAADWTGEECSQRRAEVLFEIHEDIELISERFGFSISRLLEACYEARLDLSEEDEAFIIELHEKKPQCVQRRTARRIMRCAREIGALH